MGCYLLSSATTAALRIRIWIAVETQLPIRMQFLIPNRRLQTRPRCTCPSFRLAEVTR